MISFVIYDDKEEILNRFEKVVINLMNKENQEYRIEKFSKYTKKFESIISDNTKNKIYIMDIEIPGSISGIDVAKIINDYWNYIYFCGSFYPCSHTWSESAFA